MKNLIMILLFSALSSAGITGQHPSLFDISIDKINGSKLDWSAFSNKKIIIVNVASECGFTPQYAQLQELFENYKDRLVVIGIPSNDFGAQEPGSHEEIASFCTKNYGVSFPMTEKVNILADPIHPVYEWLTKKEKNGVSENEVKWNFYKFLINEDGSLHACLPSTADPFSDEIMAWINR